MLFRLENLDFPERHTSGIYNDSGSDIWLTLSLPSSKSTFSQPLKEKCLSEVLRIR